MHHVIQGDVPLPLAGGVAGGGEDVVAFQVHHRGLQARKAQRDEVVGVLRKRSALAGLNEGLHGAVGVEVQAGAALAFVDQAALVELGEVAVVGDLLIARRDRMRAQRVNERGAPGVVVDFAVAVLGIAAELIAFGTPGGAAVFAVGSRIEVTQVGFQ